MQTDFINPLDDFVEAAISSLPDYLNQPNTVAMLEVELSRLLDLETAMIDLAEQRMLENAESYVLDEIGNQVNKPRGGLSDASYRSSLNIYQASLKSSGTRTECNYTLDSLFPDSSYFLYKGKNYRIDLYAKSECFDVETLVGEIVDIFPVITHLRVIELPLTGIPFGFKGDKSTGGFASSTNRVFVDAGKFSRIVYTTDEAIHPGSTVFSS